MSMDGLAVKHFIRRFIAERGIEEVPPKRASSGKVHLEVWRTPGKGRPIGLEMGHDGLVNLWLVALNVPKELPDHIELTKKVPKGREWTDAAGDGANSNLSAYDEFRTKPIVRLKVRSVEDARLVLEALLK